MKEMYMECWNADVVCARLSKVDEKITTFGMKKRNYQI
jgi:hypothetical protein